jgi:hypothetical protein
VEPQQRKPCSYFNEHFIYNTKAYQKIDFEGNLFPPDLTFGRFRTRTPSKNGRDSIIFSRDA